MRFNIIKKITDWLKNVFQIRQKKKPLEFKKSDEKDTIIIQELKKDLQYRQLAKTAIRGDIGGRQTGKEFNETSEDTIGFPKILFKGEKVREKLTGEMEEEYKDAIEKTDGKRPERKKERKKKSKPYIKKSPTKPSKVIKKTIDKEQEIQPISQKEIDLGKRRQAKRNKTPNISEMAPIKGKVSITSARVAAPFVEIDLDEAKVFLIIPRQKFEFTTDNDGQKQLNYKIKVNDEEDKLQVNAHRMRQILEISEKRIELKKPLQEFEVIYPPELGGKVYRYKHMKEPIYVFTAIGNNLGRMHYLYDFNGNVNPLPQKGVWVLLHEDFELAIEPDIIEDIWIWENYRLFYVNLKKVKKLVIIDRNTNKKIFLPCESSFLINSDEVIYDDFGEQSPIFTGKSIEIIAPIVNEEGWVVWVQNKQAGYKIVSDNWSGKEPLKLNLDHDLPCECGEFQVDICGKNEEPVTTLFFRYVSSLQLNYPTEIIIPNSQNGHKTECIEVIFGSDFKEWELETHRKIEFLENGYRVELPPEQNTLRFSICKRNKPETEVRFQITVPRVKWKVSNQEDWSDRPLQIKREELKPSHELHLVVCAGEIRSKHSLFATLKSNNQKLQEGKFSRKGMNFLLYLNEFHETIVNTGGKLTLTIGVDNKLWFDAIYFPPDFGRLKEIINLLESLGYGDLPDCETALEGDYEKAEIAIHEKINSLREVCEYVVQVAKNEELSLILKQAHESLNQNNLIDSIEKYSEIITKFKEEMNSDFRSLIDEVERLQVNKKFLDFYNKYLKQDILKMKSICSKQLIDIRDIQNFYESCDRISEEIRIIEHRRNDFWIRFVSDMKNPGNIQYLVKKWQYFKERDGNLNRIDKDFDEKYVFKPLGEDEEIKRAVLKFFIPKSLNELNLYDRLRYLDYLSEKDRELALTDANRFFSKLLKIKKEIQNKWEMKYDDGSS